MLAVQEIILFYRQKLALIEQVRSLTASAEHIIQNKSSLDQLASLLAGRQRLLSHIGSLENRIFPIRRAVAAQWSTLGPQDRWTIASLRKRLNEDVHALIRKDAHLYVLVRTEFDRACRELQKLSPSRALHKRYCKSPLQDPRYFRLSA
ncbi:MAG TPA: hypothetical protein PKJ77_00910 [Thermodesulfobacteriota bacterium]|nr:hypothetical protein [Deltaproteobacteria bacterium]HNR12085.1 hypothetical protein [Thermodesulfobacteriota bacterium]HNU70275.1 hypothetical protein [Thermodesulfobacteriota bacterium]HOC37822.1 hypothetical protein [Thermodesulfobacteriota bacterium]